MKTGKVVDYQVPLRRAGQIAHGGLQIDLDKQGRVYYGNMSQMQIARLDPKTGKMETFQLPKPEATWGDAHLTMIDPAHMDVDGQLWFNIAADTGESGGTWRVDLAKNKWTPIRYTQGSPSARAYDVIADSQNNAWGMHMTNDKIWKTDAKTLQTVWYDFHQGAGCRRCAHRFAERIWCGGVQRQSARDFRHEDAEVKVDDATEVDGPYDASTTTARTRDCRWWKRPGPGTRDRRIHRVSGAGPHQRASRGGAEVGCALEPLAG